MWRKDVPFSASFRLDCTQNFSPNPIEHSINFFLLLVVFKNRLINFEQSDAYLCPRVDASCLYTVVSGALNPRSMAPRCLPSIPPGLNCKLELLFNNTKTVWIWTSHATSIHCPSAYPNSHLFIPSSAYDKRKKNVCLDPSL